MKSKILKKHRNQIPLFLEERGFAPSDFQLHETDLSIGLQYRSSPMKFNFTRSKDSFQSFTYQFTRFTANFQNLEAKSKYVGFNEILTALDTWIRDHLSEYIIDIEEIDYFSQWINSSNSAGIEQIDFESSEPFTGEEIRQIRIGLEEVKYLVSKNLELSKTELNIVNQRIDYLSESLERTSTKTDWKNIAISTLINLITTLSLNPEQASRLWGMFHKIIDSIPRLVETVMKHIT